MATDKWAEPVAEGRGYGAAGRAYRPICCHKRALWAGSVAHVGGAYGIVGGAYGKGAWLRSCGRSLEALLLPL